MNEKGWKKVTSLRIKKLKNKVFLTADEVLKMSRIIYSAIFLVVCIANFSETVKFNSVPKWKKQVGMPQPTLRAIDCRDSFSYDLL